MKILVFSLTMLLFALNLQANSTLKLIAEAGESADYNGADEVIIFDSTTVNVQESGLSFVEMHKLTKILTLKSAKHNNVVKLGYDPLSAYIEIQQVLVYRANGSIDTIHNPVLDYPAPARAIYWGAREKMVEIGRLDIGDAIEVKFFKKGYTYALLLDGGMNTSEDERYIPPMRGHYYDIVPFWSNSPILKKVYQVVMPIDKTLQYEVYNGKLAIDEKETATTQSYTFVSDSILPIKAEHRMVAKNDVLCKLLLSTSPDWEAKSLWFFGVNDDYGSFTPTPELQTKTNELLLGATDEMDSIARLTHWVADYMRYSGISMGEGEGYTLHNAEMNFTDRCGVCKDKASLLIAMLRAAGFESYAAMTMAGERIDPIPADQFNHSVAVVKLHNGEYELLDPTWVPGVRELWSSAEQQQHYLMGTPEGSTLMCTPISEPENHYVHITGVSKILKDGTLEGEITITAEGQSDAAVRRIFSGAQRGDWKQNAEKELLRNNPRAKITELVYTSNDNYLDQPVKITYTYTIPNFAIVTPEEIIFTPLSAQNFYKRAMSHLYFNTSEETKAFAFKDACSRQVIISEEITLPKYKKAIQIPTVEPVDNEYISFKGGYTLEKKTLSLQEEISLGKRIYDAEEWKDFKRAVDNQKFLAKELIILQR